MNRAHAPQTAPSAIRHVAGHTMRDRDHAQVRAEVKQAALRQLAESGPAGLSVSAIAKELGRSQPALYRYFASRGELLTDLVIDAYHDLTDALRAAISDAPSHDPHARFEALARGYRSWALAQPHRYRLLFGPPLPRHDAHAQRLVAASHAAMNLLLGVLCELRHRTTAPPPSRLPPSSQRGRKRTPSTLTRRSPCTPSSSGATCTAWSASKSLIRPY